MPERGCILENYIFRFAEMVVRDRCSTSYDLASIFRGRRSTSDTWSGKIAKHNDAAASSALNCPFLKEVSQNCFGFNGFKCKIEEVSHDFIVLEL